MQFDTFAHAEPMIRPAPAHTGDIAGAILDELRFGFVACGIDGSILHANTAARKMMALGSPIRAQNGHLQCTTPKQTDRLLASFASVTQTAATTLPAASVTESICLKTDCGHDDPSIAVVRPLALPNKAKPAVAVYVMHARNDACGIVSSVATCLGFTSSEARVIELLVQGQSVEDVAKSLGISKNTVRTHLRKVFSKTGITRQTQLIAFIHEMRPPLRATIW
jgi:DNA-binding CsgD family transcriptional regulator